MQLKQLTALNWFLGSLAMAGAVVVPLHQFFVAIPSAQSSAVSAVAALVRAEARHYQNHKELVYFQAKVASQGDRWDEFSTFTPGSTALGFPDKSATSDFYFEAVSSKNHFLTVRAVTSSEALSSGKLPAMHCAFDISSADFMLKYDEKAPPDVKCAWIVSPPGLLGLIGL